MTHYTDRVDALIKDFLSTFRAVLFGTSAAAWKHLAARRAETLMGYQAAIGVMIGMVLGIESGQPLRVIGIPLLLAGVTIVWILVFAVMMEVSREQMGVLYRCFFGSSMLLLPGIVPIVGPPLLAILFIGWPCILTRLLAVALDRKPGRIFINLIGPMIAVVVLLKVSLSLAGNVFSDIRGG